MMEFNLIEKGFVPCLRLDGQPVEYGLRDVLLKAHEIAEVRDNSPLVTVALHRLLLAILHRCYDGPKNSAERVAIRKAGCFDAERVTRYFERWADRFDLFHEKYAFFQQPGFTTKKTSGINRMSQELACGNNAALFDHTTEDRPPSVTPGHAARLVIAEQAFGVGGGNSETENLRHAPLVSAAVVLVRGDTVFETLWLNLTPYDGDQKPVPSDEEDAPVWERSPTEPHKETANPRGYLDYLTWQSRTLRLHPEEVDGEVIVRRLSYAQGRKLETGPGFYDPMIAFYRGDKKDAFKAVRFNELRDLWRDSAALFQVSEQRQEYDRAPTCLHSLTAPALMEVVPRSARYELSVFGLCMDPRKAAKVKFWRHESLPLPLAYLELAHAELLVESLKIGLRLAERVARIVKVATYEAVVQIKKDLALTKPEEAIQALEFTQSNDRSPKPRPDSIGNRVKSLAPDRDYWAQLQPHFRLFLEKLALAPSADGQSGELGLWFHRSLAPLAEHAYMTVARALARSQRDLHGIAVGERYLATRLRRLGKKYRTPEESHTEASHA